MGEYHCLRLAGDCGQPGGATDPCGVPDRAVPDDAEPDDAEPDFADPAGVGCAHPAAAPGTGGPLSPAAVGGVGGISGVSCARADPHRHNQASHQSAARGLTGPLRARSAPQNAA